MKRGESSREDRQAVVAGAGIGIIPFAEGEIEPGPFYSAPFILLFAAHYRWSSYRSNALGQAEPRVTPHPVYTDIARDESERQAAYRQFFRPQLDDDAIYDIRLALNQSLPLGNSRFHEQIERAVGERREARPRGRPRSTGKGFADGAQQQLDLLANG